MDKDTRAHLRRMRIAAALVAGAAERLASARTARNRALVALVLLGALLGLLARAAHRVGWPPAGVALVGAAAGVVLGTGIELVRRALTCRRERKQLEAARALRDGEDGDESRW